MIEEDSEHPSSFAGLHAYPQVDMHANRKNEAPIFQSYMPGTDAGREKEMNHNLIGLHCPCVFSSLRDSSRSRKKHRQAETRFQTSWFYLNCNK